MSGEDSEYRFTDPWWSAAERGAEFEEAFLRQLKVEVGPGHELYDLHVGLIGCDGASDDRLFEILDGSGRMALVHLTWSPRQQRPPYPFTVIFPDFATFAESVMGEPDHDDNSVPD